ncbi:GAL3ST1 [Branchiostoma lanceolatum]|uniref:GAL3ST1 protein n=1 Tax=Branchiostoma lanceolatum TaxID=7740 RepID=A0A8J9ZDF5_BRALA|nr:GAL3ST1 [Branchiostoma lanceolatum]
MVTRCSRKRALLSLGALVLSVVLVAHYSWNVPLSFQGQVKSKTERRRFNAGMIGKNATLREDVELRGKAFASNDKDVSRGRLRGGCRRKSNIVFLKSHKTASSTVQNILMRYGLINNLTFALPKKENFLNWPKFFHKSSVLQEHLHGNQEGLHGNHTSYNILCHHTRFHHDNIRDLMPNDSVYVTIVRNPSDMFESIFTYRRLDKTYHISQPDSFKAFLDSPSDFVEKYGRTEHTQNPLFYDLGYDSNQLTSSQTIRLAIDRIDRIFSVVMVADYFEESLILMKHVLCWSLDDVTFFKVNVRSTKSVRHVTADMAGKIRQWNKADAMLFEHFNRTLWAKLSKLPFNWREEVQLLKERNQRLKDECLKSDDASNAEIRDEKFRVWEPEGVSVRGFLLRDSVRENRTCVNMAKPPKPFTYELQDRERARFRLGTVGLG